MSSSSASLMSTLANNYHLRKDLQKIEFFTCWAVVFITVGLTITSYHHPSYSTQLLLPCMVFYLKASVISRIVAYLFDFSNAAIKNHGALPLWLVLHHSGVLIQHISKAILLDGSSCLQIMLFALGSQSTHNTWTKKLSIVLYWGNVLVGVVTSLYVHSIHGSNANHGSGAALAFCTSLLVTSCGIVLLIVDTYCAKMRGKLCLRMSTTIGSGSCPSSVSTGAMMSKQIMLSSRQGLSQRKMI